MNTQRQVSGQKFQDKFLTYVNFLVLEGVKEVSEQLLAVLLLVATETRCSTGQRYPPLSECISFRTPCTGHLHYQDTNGATHLSHI